MGLTEMTGGRKLPIKRCLGEEHSSSGLAKASGGSVLMYSRYSEKAIK